MSPVLESIWNGTTWSGMSVTPPPDTFILGTTIPDATNTGVLTGVTRTTYSGPTTITGSSNVNSPTLIENKNVTSLITVSSGYVRFYNCFFSGGPGSFDTGQIDCRPSGVLGVSIERCTFRPNDPSHYLNAMIGHHYMVYRCDVSKVVDCFGVYNQYGPDANVRIEGCYGHDMAHFSAPTNGIVHPSDTHTHGDWIQVQGGRSVWCRGNAVHGYCKDYQSSLAGSLGYDTVAVDGSTPSAPYDILPQGFLTQENVAFGGVYYADDYICDNNWWWGTQQTIRPATRSNNITNYDLQAVGNTWMDMPRDWGGSLHYYTIRPTSNVTVNGISYPTTGGTADVNNNKFDTGTDVLLAYRGTAVMVRCDAGG